MAPDGVYPGGAVQSGVERPRRRGDVVVPAATRRAVFVRPRPRIGAMDLDRRRRPRPIATAGGVEAACPLCRSSILDPASILDPRHAARRARRARTRLWLASSAGIPWRRSPAALPATALKRSSFRVRRRTNRAWPPGMVLRYRRGVVDSASRPALPRSGAWSRGATRQAGRPPARSGARAARHRGHRAAWRSVASNAHGRAVSPACRGARQPRLAPRLRWLSRRVADQAAQRSATSQQARLALPRPSSGRPARDIDRRTDRPHPARRAAPRAQLMRR